MGAIRGILLVFVVVLLFLSVLSANLFWALTVSLNYDNVQEESTSIIKDFLQGMNMTGIIKQNYPLIQFYCINHSEYTFNYQGYTLDIPCSVVAQGENAIVEEGIRDLIKGVYYTKYDCNFLDCPSKFQLPLFLISEKAHDFWKSNLYFALGISFVLLALLFLFIEKKTNLPILAGSLLVVSSLIFIKLDSLFSLFSNQVIFKFLKIFFSKSYFVSFRILIAGIVLVITGIVLKIFKVGFSISDFISKLKEKAMQQKAQAKKKRKKKSK